MTTPPILRPSVPLSVGELLDRAVTMFVRNFWVFAVVAAVLYIPVAIAQLGMLDFYKLYGDMMGTIFSSDPAKTAAQNDALIKAMSGRFALSNIVQFTVLVIGWPLVTAATVHITSRLLLQRPVSSGEALRYGLTKWGRVALYVLLWLLIWFAVAFIIFLLFMIAVITIAVPAKSIGTPLPGIIIGIVILLAMLVGSVIVGLAAWVAFGVGLAAAVVEDLGPTDAIARGFRYAWNRALFWRSVLIGLVMIAITLAVAMLVEAVAFIGLALVHSGLPIIIFSAVLSPISYALPMIVMVLYYYDLNVRLQGADLEMLLARVAST